MFAKTHTILLPLEFYKYKNRLFWSSNCIFQPTLLCGEYLSTLCACYVWITPMGRKGPRAVSAMGWALQGCNKLSYTSDHIEQVQGQMMT